MIASQLLQTGLDALFVTAAAASVLAVVATWISVRPAIAALRGELERSGSGRPYRFTIVEMRAASGKVLAFASPAARVTDRPSRPAPVAPGLDWPGLRAAA